MSEEQKPIEQIIMEFEHELRRQYGVTNPITRIDFSHEVFNILVVDLYRKYSIYSSFRPSDASDLKLNGIEINARERRT